MPLSLVCALLVSAHAAAVRLAPLPAAPIVSVPLVAPSAAPLTPSLVPSFSQPLLAPQLGPTIPKVQGIPVSRPAAPAELDFAAKASAELASIADDIGAELGRKGSRMTGQDFLDLVEAGRARYDELYAEKAPSPEAFRAARTVQEQALRVARALLDPQAPLMDQVRRALAVWNVFNQELAAAASKGTLDAIEEEARLFASQVERSV